MYFLIASVLLSTPSIAVVAKDGQEIVVTLYSAGKEEEHIAWMITRRADSDILIVTWREPREGNAVGFTTTLPFKYVIRKVRPKDYTHTHKGPGTMIWSVGSGGPSAQQTTIDGKEYRLRSEYGPVDGWIVEIGAFWFEIDEKGHPKTVESKDAEGVIEYANMLNFDGTPREAELAPGMLK